MDSHSADLESRGMLSESCSSRLVLPSIKRGTLYSQRVETIGISLFTANGKFLRCFEKKSTQPGMFQYPRHLCIDQQGPLVVADELNQHLQIFSV